MHFLRLKSSQATESRSSPTGRNGQQSYTVLHSPTRSYEYSSFQRVVFLKKNSQVCQGVLPPPPVADINYATLLPAQLHPWLWNCIYWYLWDICCLLMSVVWIWTSADLFELPGRFKCDTMRADLWMCLLGGDLAQSNIPMGDSSDQ